MEAVEVRDRLLKNKKGCCTMWSTHINMERRRCCVTSQSRDDIVSRDLFHFPLDKSGGCSGLLKNIGTVFFFFLIFVLVHTEFTCNFKNCLLHPAAVTTSCIYLNIIRFEVVLFCSDRWHLSLTRYLQKKVWRRIVYIPLFTGFAPHVADNGSGRKQYLF